jgi:uncharacterized protein
MEKKGEICHEYATNGGITMKDFVEYLVKNIVSDPESVKVTQSDGQKRSLVEIHVASDDIGKIVGKNGRVIRSIRTLTSSIGTKVGYKVDVVVVGSHVTPEVQGA